VALATALRYKGQGPMLTYVLHRLGGLGMAIFITIHILASFVGGKTGVFLNTIYENWAFQIFIFFCVMFHAVNGLRITILDLWPSLLVHQREAIWVEWAVFLPLYGFAVLVILRTALGG
jgi:succinate dehydrogenase / fumarate reductase cytochrome b subunit